MQQQSAQDYCVLQLKYLDAIIALCYIGNMTNKQLQKWIDSMGGRDEAAEYLGVHPATVWRWLKKPELLKKRTIISIQTQISEIHP